MSITSEKNNAAKLAKKRRDFYGDRRWRKVDIWKNFCCNKSKTDTKLDLFFLIIYFNHLNIFLLNAVINSDIELFCVMAIFAKCKNLSKIEQLRIYFDYYFL